MLDLASVRRESIVDSGIQLIRKRKSNGESVYMIVNSTDRRYEGWIGLASMGDFSTLYDPMDGRWGAGRTRKNVSGRTEVYFQLDEKQTVILETGDKSSQAPPFTYLTESGEPIALTGSWKIRFESENAPRQIETAALASWTTFGPEYAAYSGTALYRLTFAKPKTSAKSWLLDLGDLHESAEVFINNKSVGTVIGPAYRVVVDSGLIVGNNNVLEVRVSNLMANRIADMDRKKIFWKKFYNVNVAARKAENRKNGIFDASEWKPADSGLIGPVRIIPLGK
jgi:hypothetical protein